MRRTRVGERLPPLRPAPLDVLVMDAHWLALDEAIDEELQGFVQRREAELPDEFA